MVKDIVHRLRAWLVLTLSLCFFSASCVAREVTSVTIEATGLYEQSNHSSVRSECEAFRPTHRQIKRFFSKAYPVEGYVLLHSRYSPCYAYGSIKFSDEHFGKWTLHSSGAARLIFNRGDEVTVFYGKNGWIDPFSGSYDYRGD